MVKPVFQALNDMRASATAAEAAEVLIDFLHKDGASKVNSSQAGTFLKEAETYFLRHQAPNQYEAVLVAAMKVGTTRASGDLQELAGYALLDFSRVSRSASEAPVNLADAPKILLDVQRHANAHGMAHEGIELAALTSRKSFGSSVAASPYAELEAAYDKKTIQAAIATIMLRQTIEDEQAPRFFRLLNAAFHNARLEMDDRVDLLMVVADKAQASDKIYDMVVDASDRLISDSEGPAPSEHDINGRHPQAF